MEDYRVEMKVLFCSSEMIQEALNVLLLPEGQALSTHASALYRSKTIYRYTYVALHTTQSP
jgi:hypothetical protein